MGKRSAQLDAAAFQQKIQGYRQVWIDIGTGDGKFVAQTARSNPAFFIVGLDACRENLHAAARRRPENALFVIANALALPEELSGVAARLTINFPWGSLLLGLLAADVGLMNGLCTAAARGAAIDVRLNSSALAEAGWSLEAGGRQVGQTLQAAGFRIRVERRIGPADLRSCPSSWARRLAFGRSPSAIHLHGVLD